MAPSDPPPPPSLLVNDGDDGYQESGAGWVPQTDPLAFRGEYRQHGPSDPPTSDTASWSLAGVKPGWYQVQVTWLEGPDRTSVARYTVYDAANALGAYAVDQRAAPADAADEGRPWQILAATYFESGSARIELSGQGDGLVIADGARLVPLRNTVELLSLDRSLSRETLDAQVTVVVAPNQ